MENRDDQNKGQNADLSKAQSQQQPQSERSQRPEEGQGSQSEAGQSAEGAFGQSQQSETTSQAGFGETATQQRSDVEGSSFVGSQGSKDSSSELIEDEGSDFAKDGRGATE